jgi:hypothetical protein
MCGGPPPGPLAAHELASVHHPGNRRCTLGSLVSHPRLDLCVPLDEISPSAPRALMRSLNYCRLRIASPRTAVRLCVRRLKPDVQVFGCERAGASASVRRGPGRGRDGDWHGLAAAINPRWLSRSIASGCGWRPGHGAIPTTSLSTRTACPSSTPARPTPLSKKTCGAPANAKSARRANSSSPLPPVSGGSMPCSSK